MTEAVSIGLAIQVGGLIVSAVILVLGVKFAVNGMRRDAKEMKADLKTLIKSDAKQTTTIAVHGQRLVSLESRIKKVEE